MSYKEITQEIQAELQVGLVDVKEGCWIQAVYEQSPNVAWIHRITKITPKFIHTQSVIVSAKHHYRPHYEQFKADGKVFEETQYYFIHITDPTKHKKSEIIYSKIIPTPMLTIPAQHLAELRAEMAESEELINKHVRLRDLNAARLAVAQETISQN